MNIINKTKYYIAKVLKKSLAPPALNNCELDPLSKVHGRSDLNSVKIGKYSGTGYDSVINNANIGSFTAIAPHCYIGGASHPLHRVSTNQVFHDGRNVFRKNFATFPSIPTPTTVIGNDVWIGYACVIKAGITIHDGAVLGFGSVLTHDIPPYEIWAGNPAHKIGQRFDDDTIAALLELQWWNWPDEKIEKYSVYFDDPKKLIEACRKN